MSAQNKPDFQSEVWPKIRKVIGDIVEKSADGDYIYRGESKCYEKVSSGLYRAYTACPGRRMEIRAKDIPGAIQESVGKILSDAKAYLDEPDDSEILTQLQLQRGTVDPDVVLVPGLETILARAQASLGKSTDFKILARLQHYGLKTNLIDFTTNPLIALFFACNSSFDEDGRIIVLKRQPAKDFCKDFCIKEAPPIIRHAVSQRSIFVEAHKGFIKRGHYEVIRIGKCLKLPIQKYLEESHGISTKGVYGDIHGFIRTHDIYPDPYRKLLDGQDCYNNAVETKKPEERLQGYKKAVGIFTEILGIDSYFHEAYLNRGRVYFQLSEKDPADSHGYYDKAIKDYTKVIALEPDYAEAYAERGKVYNIMGKFDAAARDFKKAICLRVEPGTVHSDLCASLMSLGKWEELRSRLTTPKNQMQKGETDEGSLNADPFFLAKYAKENRIEMPEEIERLLKSSQELATDEGEPSAETVLKHIVKHLKDNRIELSKDIEAMLKSLENQAND